MLIPKILTIIFVVVALLLTAILMRGAWKHRNPSAINNLPEEIKDFGPTATNRWLRGLRAFFVLMILTLLGFHSYWVFRADSNPDFANAKRRDARNLRIGESGLKGWVLDRTGKLDNALIRYRNDNGVIIREYPLGAAAVHLAGYLDYPYSSGGFEAAYRNWLTTPISLYNKIQSPNPVGKDLKVSLDANLQREAFSLLQSQLQKTGKSAAAVMLLLPNNEVLAMATAPSFDPDLINNAKEWSELKDQAKYTPATSPLVNRVLGTWVTGGPAFYYRPGSTFKTFIAAVALDCGLSNEKFECKSEGFAPSGGNTSIKDYGGEGEVHGTIGLDDAFKKSCNQYFAQLGLRIGRARLAEYAQRLHFAVSPDDKSERAQNTWQIEPTDAENFNAIFSPPIQRVNFSNKATAYDVALQSIGQGYADLTVMEMAMIASCAATDGSLASATFEVGAPRKASEFIKPESAAKLRELMRTVVQPGGTAPGVFSGHGSGAGKTGTADRDYRKKKVTDAWFIGFAPADNPQVAFAVFVEDVGTGNTGGKIAAPIAAKLVEKAGQLGYVKIAQLPPPPIRPQPRAKARR